MNTHQHHSGGSQNEDPIGVVMSEHGMTDWSSDERVVSELRRLGHLVMLEEQTARRPARVARRPVALAAAVALGVGGTAAAAASGLGLFSGYIGTAPLVLTESWGPEWQKRIDAHSWPEGSKTSTFVDVHVEAGAARPDAIPSDDLDREVLVLNGCAWMSAYLVRVADNHLSGQDEARTALSAALNLPAAEALDDDPLLSTIKQFTAGGDPLPVAREFVSASCDRIIVQDVVRGVR